MKPIIYLGAAVAIVLLAVALSTETSSNNRAAASGANASPVASADTALSLEDASANITEEADQRFDESTFLAELRERFGPHLHIKHAQIRTLEQVMSYLKARYPQDWESRVLDLLNALFPEQAQALYARFLSLQQYNLWLTQNRDDLRRLSAAERRAAMWDARELAFGADAQDIWAAEKRSQDLGDALAQLPDELAPVERAQQFRQAIEQVYGEDAQALLDQKRTELINHMLDQEALQAELRTMPASRRRETLQEVRSAMGMPEDALARWGQLDQQRDQTWDAGQAYMAQRKTLLEQYPNDSEWRVAELQETMLGEMAALVRQEEQGGFFRYASERRIGRE